MRVVALSNERATGADPDIPWALQQLKAQGLVSEYSVFSVPVRVAAVGEVETAREVAREILSIAADVVIFFHSGSCLFSEKGLMTIRSANPEAVWLYREGDPFSQWTLPYPRRAFAAARRCDTAFIFCDGYLAQLLTRSGCPRVTYAPSCVNTERFPRSWQADGPFSQDVVFIGNDVRSRVRRIPGQRERAELVRALQAEFGDRLAVYGSGWEGVGARGTCSFSEVPAIYSRSRVCVGIDHAVGAYQFSNRLPIALACGIPLVHSSFRGVDEVLPSMKGVRFFDGSEECVASLHEVLSMSEDEAAEASRQSRRTAETTLSMDRLVGFMLETAADIVRGGDGRVLANPWIDDSEFGHRRRDTK